MFQQDILLLNFLVIKGHLNSLAPHLSYVLANFCKTAFYWLAAQQQQETATSI